MKNRKWLIALLCIGFMLLCYSCGFFGAKKYESDVDTVKSIQIVRLEESEQEGEDYKYTVLATVYDHQKFFDKLDDVKQTEMSGGPQILLRPCTVIRIEFQNGDVDLLADYAQERIRSNVTHLGYIIFDEKQFAELIYGYYPYYYSTPDSAQPELPPHKK